MRICRTCVFIVCYSLLLGACSQTPAARQPTTEPELSVAPSALSAEAESNTAMPSDAPVLQQPTAKMDVLRKYAAAAELVKLRCPGFTRTLRNEIFELDTEGGTVARILGALTNILLEDDRSADSVKTIRKGDDLACRTYFPVYDTEFGCRLLDGSSVASASCHTADGKTQITLLFHSISMEDAAFREFCGIMTPFSKEALVENINAYIPYINEENLQCTLRYFNCELECVLDEKTGRMLSLSQKMVTELTMQIAVELLIAEKTVNGTAIMINHLSYADFLW